MKPTDLAEPTIEGAKSIENEREKRKQEMLLHARARFLHERPNVSKMFNHVVRDSKAMTADEFFETYTAEVDPGTFIF